MKKTNLAKAACIALAVTMLPIDSIANLGGDVGKNKVLKTSEASITQLSEGNQYCSAETADKFSVECIKKTDSSVTISWTDVFQGAKGSYSVYVDAFPIKENINTTSYTITDLLSASKHNIYVKAVSASGDIVETSDDVNVTTDLIIDTNTALWKDQTVGDVYINNGATLNLNGHTLNVKGSVYVSYGTLKIGGGSLIVDGDLRIQETNTASDGNKTYSPCYSYFVMNDENDNVIVKGSFYDASRYTHEGYLTNGTLSINGDFVQISGSGSNFFASGDHRTVLSGDSLQNVDLVSLGTHFATLELENFSEEGVFFNKPISADEFIQNGCNVSFQDAGILGWTLKDDYTYTGDLNLLGDTLDLNGHTLTVNGDLIQSGGNIKIDGGELIVNGNYKIQTAGNAASSGTLEMKNTEDKVTVTGNFETRSTADHSNLLTAGTMTIGGSFNQFSNNRNNFKTSGTHKVILNGSEKQTVSFSDPGYSYFNELEITNTSDDGVALVTTVYVVKTLHDTDSVVTGNARMYLGSSAQLADNKWSYDLCLDSNRTLSDDWKIDGSLFLTNGTLNVNGKKLTVGKDIGISGGTLYVNGGTVETGKDLWIRDYYVSNDGTVTFYGGCYGYLKMTNENDFVKVNGSFITDTYRSHNGYLTNGILEVKGNFTQMRSNENFKATNEHKVVLSGVKQQRISFESNTSKFNILEVNKPLNTGYIFSRTPLWETLIETEKDSEAPTAPSDLSSDIQTATSVKLNWKKSTDNNEVVGYDVYRNGVRIGNSTGTSFVDERLKSNTAYTYYVVAYDTMRNESDWSNIIQAKTLPDENAPTQPTDLKVKKQSDSAVTFSWTASEDNTEVKGYDVYRNNVLIGTVDGTSFTDNAIAAGLYKYYVKAFDDTNNYSVASETLTIDTEAPLPPVLMIDSSDNEKASMYWTCSDNVSVVKYEIYRDGKKIKTLTEDEFTDSELEYDKQYEYHVAAYDAAGNRSKDSNTVTVFTGEDEEPPVVTSIKPGSAVYSKTIPVVIKAKDNAGVSAVVVQSSLDSTEWTDVETVAANGRSTVEVSYDLDISGYDDGAVYVRTIAVDTKGNESSTESALIGSYTVDNTAPKAPANVSVSETKGQLQISWDDPKDSDVNYFRIYRADSGNDSFEIIADKLETLNFFDTDIELSESYDYYVTAIDYAENESSKSKIVSGGISEDKVKPQVLSVLPTTGTKIPNNRPISISCKDNFRLDSITVEFAPEGTDLWEQMYSSKLSKTSQIVAFNADMTGMADGKYDVRVKVTDKAGLESDYYTCVYDYKSCSIPEPKLYVTEGGWSVKLNWSTTNDPSLMGYNIYKRSADMTSFELLGSTSINEYTDTNVVAGKTYFYYVEAVDDYCNTISSEKKMAIPTSQDDTVPVANAGSDGKALSNLAFEFDASGSTDNHFIDSYKWDFGDGETSDSMKPTHTYSEPGIYTVGLTVTDSSGNSSTTSINVQVYDDSEYAYSDIRLIYTSSNSYVSDALVYLEFDGEEYFDNTDANGCIRLIAPIGEHKVSFYKNGYLPTSETISFANSRTNKIVSIEKGELISGGLVANQMTLEQIEAAGIDTTDPSNQYVYKFDVIAGSHDVHDRSKFYVYVNGEGDLINTDSTFEYLGEHIVKIDTGNSGGSGNYGGGSCYCSFIPSNKPGVAPSVVSFRVITAFVWLKDFFDVTLSVDNNASEEFVFSNCKAELILPENMSLPKINGYNSAVQNMNDIHGGRSSLVKWYVRGDAIGEDYLKANFSAMLSPFNTEVTKKFKTDKKISIIGGEALKLTVKQKYYETNSGMWRADFELENVSENTIYNPRINYSFYSEFMYCTEMHLKYPNGATKIILWDDESDDPSEEEFLPAFIKKDSSDITELKKGEKITGCYFAYRNTN